MSKTYIGDAVLWDSFVTDNCEDCGSGESAEKNNDIVYVRNPNHHILLDIADSTSATIAVSLQATQSSSSIVALRYHLLHRILIRYVLTFSPS